MKRHLEAVEATCYPGCLGCHKCCEDPVAWVTQTRVMLSVKNIRLLAALIERYEAEPSVKGGPYAPFVEYVENGYGMHGLLVIWECDDGECVDLWWFADECEYELIPTSGGLLDQSIRVDGRSEDAATDSGEVA